MNVNNFDRQCLGGNLELSHLETDLEFKLFNYINSSYDSYSLFFAYLPQQNCPFINLNKNNRIESKKIYCNFLNIGDK